MKKNISFSSDTNQIAREDLEITGKMSEDYFGMQKDPNQLPATPETKDWIYKNSKKCVNIIRNNDEIIGYAFMLPANKEIMQEFILKKINEKTLFEKIKILDLNQPPETIYLCASIVKKEFRNKNLATMAFIKIINKITNNLKVKSVLFYDPYTNEGNKLTLKIAKLTKLKLIKRKE